MLERCPRISRRCSIYDQIPLGACGESAADKGRGQRSGRSRGYIIAAQVQVVWLQCLGRKVDQMVVVAHTLPFGSLADGLLSIDFLRHVNARILLPEGVIDIP